jgi:hypothetical protein
MAALVHEGLNPARGGPPRAKIPGASAAARTGQANPCKRNGGRCQAASRRAASGNGMTSTLRTPPVLDADHPSRPIHPGRNRRHDGLRHLGGPQPPVPLRADIAARPVQHQVDPVRAVEVLNRHPRPLSDATRPRTQPQCADPKAPTPSPSSHDGPSGKPRAGVVRAIPATHRGGKGVGSVSV